MGANRRGSIGRLIRVTAIAVVLVLCCALGADARTPEQLQPGGAPAILSCSSIKKDPAVYRVARDSSPFARVHALWAIHAVHVDGNPKSVYLRKRPPTSVVYGLLHNLTSLARPSHTWAVASPADELQVEITCPSSRGSHQSELLPARASTLWIPRSRRVSLFVGVLLLGGVTRFVYSRAFKPVVFVLALTIVSGMMADYFSRFVGLNRTHRTGPLFFASPYVALIALHLSNSRLDILGNLHDADSLVQWVVIVLGLLLLGVYIALTIFLTRNFLFDNQQVNGVCQPLNVATIAVGQVAGILALANGSEDLFISAALSTLGLSGILISHTLPYVFLTLRPLLSLFGRLGGRARGQRLTGREANGLQRQLESSQQYNATPYQPQSPNLESRDPEPDEHASPPPDALQRGGRTMISPENAAEVTRKATEDAIGQLIDKEPKFFLNLLKRHHVRNLLLCIECAY